MKMIQQTHILFCTPLRAVGLVLSIIVRNIIGTYWVASVLNEYCKLLVVNELNAAKFKDNAA